MTNLQLTARPPVSPNGHPPAPSAIMARGLTRTFGDHRAVDDLDLDVRNGEIYGFLGPNGAGKTTTVRMLCTLLAPTQGTARVAGHDVVADAGAVRLNIGVALQEAALDPRQTGAELLVLQGRLFGLSPVESERRRVEMAELVDLGDALDRRVATYSGGMRRRLDLALAMVNNPQVLFLDEPTTGLDPVSRAQIWDEVKRLNRELGTTVLLTTQYLEEADVLADRVGIIARGRLAAEGTPSELKRAVGTDVIVARVASDGNTVAEALDGVAGVSSVDHHGGGHDDTEVVIAAIDGAATIGPVAVAFDQHHIPVTNLTLRTPTLDDVFLEVTGSRIRHDHPADNGGSSTIPTSEDMS